MPELHWNHIHGGRAVVACVTGREGVGQAGVCDRARCERAHPGGMRRSREPRELTARSQCLPSLPRLLGWSARRGYFLVLSCAGRVQSLYAAEAVKAVPCHHRNRWML